MPPIEDALVSETAITFTEYDRGRPSAWRARLKTQARLLDACGNASTIGACVAALDAAPRTDRNDSFVVLADLVRGIAVAHARIYELALEVAVLRTGRCPTAADLAPPALGMTMTAISEGGDVRRIELDGKALARIHCATR